MKRWISVIILHNLGRIFNNPQLFNRIEDRLADSGPVRHLARTIVGLYQRGSWGWKQIVDKEINVKRLDTKSLKKTEEELAKKIRTLQSEWKKRSQN